MNTRTSWASAQDRSRFFWWLAEWLLRPPTQDAVASLSDLAVPDSDGEMDSVALALQQFVAEARRYAGAEAITRLGTEYTRLMSGVQEGLGLPPAFESVWRGSDELGATTAAVIGAYAQAGFADIDLEAGPQDHIGVELKFLAMLALRESEAWAAGNENAAQTRIAQQASFLEKHLNTWVPRWADEIIRQSREPLYAALAGLLKVSLEQTRMELSSLLKEAA